VVSKNASLLSCLCSVFNGDDDVNECEDVHSSSPKG
jgi:hypothetical protein